MPSRRAGCAGRFRVLGTNGGRHSRPYAKPEVSMIAVVQRVSEAAVRVAGEIVGQIGPGLLDLASVHRDDTEADLEWTANKLVGLRVFPNPEDPDKQDG